MQALPMVRRAVCALLAASPILVCQTAIAGAPSANCDKMAAAFAAPMWSTPISELMVNAAAHETTVEVLKKDRPLLGDAWQEGNPYWEEAYAIYFPKILEVLSLAQEQAALNFQTSVAPIFPPATCDSYQQFSKTRSGALAERIYKARALEKELKSQEAHPGIARRFPRLIENSRLYLQTELAPLKDPLFNKTYPAYSQAAAEFARYDKQTPIPKDKIQDGINNTFKSQIVKELQEHQLKNVDALRSIVTRYRQSIGQAIQGSPVAQAAQSGGIALLGKDTCRDGLFPLAGSSPSGRFDSREILSICLTNPGNTAVAYQVYTNGKRVFKVTPDEAKAFNVFISNTYSVQCTDPRVPNAASNASILSAFGKSVKVDGAQALCVASTEINNRPYKAAFVFDSAGRTQESALLEPPL